jgi:hypothetical protein
VEEGLGDPGVQAQTSGMTCQGQGVLVGARARECSLVLAGLECRFDDHGGAPKIAPKIAPHKMLQHRSEAHKKFGAHFRSHLRRASL